MTMFLFIAMFEIIAFCMTLLFIKIEEDYNEKVNNDQNFVPHRDPSFYVLILYALFLVVL